MNEQNEMFDLSKEDIIWLFNDNKSMIVSTDRLKYDEFNERMKVFTSWEREMEFKGLPSLTQTLSNNAKCRMMQNLKMKMLSNQIFHKSINKCCSIYSLYSVPLSVIKSISDTHN
jgi:hypothetical protein